MLRKWFCILFDESQAGFVENYNYNRENIGYEDEDVVKFKRQMQNVFSIKQSFKKKEQWSDNSSDEPVHCFYYCWLKHEHFKE